LQILSFVYLTILYDPDSQMVPVTRTVHLLIMTKIRLKWFQNIRAG